MTLLQDFLALHDHISTKYYNKLILFAKISFKMLQDFAVAEIKW